MKKQFLKLAVLSWFIGTGTLFAQSASDYFVAIADKTSPVIIATDANQICNNISFIHAVTGKATTGTSQDGNCLGKQTSVLGNCSADGSINCVVPSGGNLKAVDASTTSVLKPENIRKGVTIGGVTGQWPAANSTDTKLSILGGTALTLDGLPNYSGITSTSSKKEYTLFGDDGKPYKFSISSIGTTVAASTTTANYTTQSNTLFKRFTLTGNEFLIPENIKAGVQISGVIGNAVPRSSWNKLSNGSGDYFSVTDRNTNATDPIAKAKVFFDPATANKWMLLRNNDTGALAKILSWADANTMCRNAKTTRDDVDMGTWALANEKELFWAQVTGGTGSNGLFAAESLFGGSEKNFWISTATADENKVAHFPNSFQPPDTDDPIPTSAMILCVQRFTAAGDGGVNVGAQPDSPFTLVTATPIAFTVNVNSNSLSLGAHIYQTADDQMALAFVFGFNPANSASSESPFPKTPVATITDVCDTVKNYLAAIALPEPLKAGTWAPLTRAQMDFHKLGFTQAPFLKTSSSATNMLYVLGRFFIASDTSASSYKTFKFSAAAAAAIEDSAVTQGSIICTGVPINISG